MNKGTKSIDIASLVACLGMAEKTSNKRTTWLRFSISRGDLAKNFRKARKILSNELGSSRLVYDYLSPSAVWELPGVQVHMSKLFKFNILEIRITKVQCNRR